VSRRKKETNGTLGQIQLKHVVPITKNQEKAFEAFEDKNLLMHGWAGTGKTYIALYMALDNVLHNNSYDKLYIVRSAVASRSIGYLPGDLEEKLEIFESPYKAIVNEQLQRFDAYDYLKSKGQIEFVSTSYLRGVTMENCIVLVDEIQNMLFHELDTIITRAGKNIKLIMAGDYHQTDLINGGKFECLDFMAIIQSLPEFITIEFGINDIVRNPLVKSYLIAKENRSVFQQL
jgi:phosphate starvation-inducible protein PhoH